MVSWVAEMTREPVTWPLPRAADSCLSCKLSVADVGDLIVMEEVVVGMTLEVQVNNILMTLMMNIMTW